MYASPADAEAAFYAAFESADLDRMMAVWDEAEDILCIHPMAQRLIGRAQVTASWRELFARPPAMRFALEGLRTSVGSDLSVHQLREVIRVAGSERVSVMLATNAYRATAHGWRMILHHASPEPGVATAQRSAGSLH